MQNSKLIQLLRTLSEKELIALEDFLGSPYFNKDQTVINLFLQLKNYYPVFLDSRLDKAVLFQVLFPGKTYNDKQFRYLLSNLNQLIERFLSIQSIEKHPFSTKLALLKTLSEKGPTKSYQHHSRQIEKEIKAFRENSDQLFLTQFQWYEIKEHHFRLQRQRKFDTSIQFAADNLDRYYFLERLKFGCAMLDRQTILQANYDLNLSKEWIIHLEQQHFFQEPIIQFYYTVFQALLEEDDEQHFLQLKEILGQHAISISSFDLREIYLFAINYCARKIRQGKEVYIAEALNLYRSGIESKALIEKGVLSPWTFTNIVKLSLRVNQYKWIEDFIHQYAPILPEAFRENALHYNLAELYYYTKRYNQAQEHLNQVAFSDLNYYLGARVLLAKIYYEINAEEPLLSLIASFTIFLKRNKQLSNDLKQTYLNFCTILFQLIRRSPSQISTLQNKIKNTSLLTDRSWLESIYAEIVK